jgi:hypothetical protein
MVIDVEGQLQEGYKMTDTAELIARVNHEVDLHEANRSYISGDIWELIADMVIALAAQAQEIEQFKTALTAARNRIEDDAQTIDRHVAKIGKLQNTLIGRE